MITMDDNYRFEDFGFICEPGNGDPLNPNMDRKTLTIPGRPGVWDFGVEIREKPFSFPLRILERFHSDMQWKFNEFIAFWFDQFGQPREVKIVRDYEPDKFYLVKLVSQIIPERLTDEGAFVLQLVANNPNKQFIVRSDEFTWDSDIPIMSDITWLYGTSEMEIKLPQTIDVQNDGNLIVRPKVLISGTADSLTLTLNGESFSFGAINQPIEINCESYMVFVNGVESITAMTGKLDKLFLSPGTNQLNVQGSGLNLTLTIQFYNQYI